MIISSTKEDTSHPLFRQIKFPVGPNATSPFGLKEEIIIIKNKTKTQNQTTRYVDLQKLKMSTKQNNVK